MAMVQDIWSIYNRKNYIRSKVDHYVYFSKLSYENYISLLIYVDDMLIACKPLIVIHRLKN